MMHERDIVDDYEALADILRAIVSSASAHAARNGFAEVDETLIDTAEQLLKEHNA